jgi:integrase/recombinase XerD
MLLSGSFGEEIMVRGSGGGLRGPLAADASGFGVELTRLGYSRSTAVKHLRLLARLSGWLDDEALGVGVVATEAVEPFFERRRAAGYTYFRTRRALTPLLGYLRRLGRLDDAVPASVGGPVEVLVDGFGVYLVRERGLVAGTVACYVRVAGTFLVERSGDSGVDLTGLNAGVVADFATRACCPLGLSAKRSTISALRCLLRYLALQGLTETGLDQAALSVAGGGVLPPRGIDPAVVRRILAGCDRRRGIGRRDYAILMLLARLGLRGGEVVGLGLGDIDWRAGEIVVRGKGGRSDRLPLPVDVGEAVAGYLRRGRPASDSRRLFLRMIAPFEGLAGTGALRSVLARACARAGVNYASPHRLRHTAATGMLAAGASLPEIGQVLRHATIGATATYARVDHEALRVLAPSWPGAER